jgi:hypothetical protein
MLLFAAACVVALYCLLRHVQLKLSWVKWLLPKLPLYVVLSSCCCHLHCCLVLLAAQCAAASVLSEVAAA